MVGMVGAALAVAIVVAVVTFGSPASRATGGAPGAKADSVWYHESDVALLATTGRPQLVEFFHPD